jgi:hypothetical protein
MFQQSSPKGFSASDGLVVFYTMLDDTNKPYIGPAQVAELEAAKFEAAAKAKGAMAAPPPASK